MSEEIKSWLIEALESYRQEIAPESAVDVRRFASFFHPMVNFTDELDMAAWIREQGEKRKKLKDRIDTAEKSNSVDRHSRLLKELSECRHPKPNERRPIDEVAEEIIFRLMAFKLVMMLPKDADDESFRRALPRRSISGLTGKPNGRFNRLATFTFEIYDVKAKVDSILDRLTHTKRIAKTEASVKETIKDYTDELAERV